MTVVGQVEPADGEDPFWSGNLSMFQLAEQGASVTVHLFTGTDTSFSGLAERYPTLLGSFRWSLFLDPGAVTYRNASQLHSSLATIETDLNKRFPRSLVVSSLANRISDYQRTLALSRLPFLILISLIFGIVLYFLAIASVVLAKERNREVVLLRSRGASLNQSSFYLPFVEAAVVVPSRRPAGPCSGLDISRSASYGSGASHRSFISPLAFRVPGFCCHRRCCCLDISNASFAVSVRLPSYPCEKASSSIDLADCDMRGTSCSGRGRRGLVAAEKPRQLLIRRNHRCWIELRPHPAAAPAFLMLASGLLIHVFCLFCFFALSRLFGDLAPFWLIESFRRIYRDYSGYVPLFLLTLFIAALAIFSANYAAHWLKVTPTKQVLPRWGNRRPFAFRSFRECAIHFSKPGGRPSIRAASPVYRGSAFEGGGSSGVTYSLLSLDSSACQLYPGSAKTLLRKNYPSLPLPCGFPHLLSRAYPCLGPRIESAYGQVRTEPILITRFACFYRTPRAGMRLLRLGNLGNTDWNVKVAELSQIPGMQSPLTLIGIYVSGGQLVGLWSGVIQLDDVFVSTVTKHKPLRTSSRLDLGPYSPMPGLSKDEVSYTSQARSGGQSLRYTWTEPITTETRGVLASPVPMPIPAIGGPGLSVDQELVVRVEGKPVGFRIVESADYFPTLFQPRPLPHYRHRPSERLL